MLEDSKLLLAEELERYLLMSSFVEKPLTQRSQPLIWSKGTFEHT